MPYLLDTNHCSYIINGRRKAPGKQKPQEAKVIAAFRSTSEPIYTCDAVVGEMYYGAEMRDNRDELYYFIHEFLVTTMPLTTDKACWTLFAQTKAGLQRNGKVIADLDLLIACTAKRYRCILVTNDTAFEHLPNSFQVENWAG